MYSEEESVVESSVTPRSLSPSPSLTAEGFGESSSTSIGRPRKSPVWRYFVYDSSTNKSTCQVSSETSLSSPEVCGHTVSGKFTTNLKRHLKQAHTSSYQEVLQEEERSQRTKSREELKAKRRATGPERSQMTLSDAFQRKYDKSSSRYQAITRKLAVFVGSTNVPNSLVENEEFKLLIKTLDPRYQVPGRSRIGKELDQVVLDLKMNIQRYLSHAHKISVCTDLWTKRGMSSSYLGITAHFFSRHDHRRHRVTLAVRKMPHPHSAENIRSTLDEVMKEWDIPLSKLNVVITDNGSNMVKAFQQVACREEEDSDDEQPETDTPEGEDEDFEEREIDHEVTFECYCKRLGCFSHTLQLVMHKFNEHPFQALSKKIHALVRKVNKSSKATECLLLLCNKKLVSDCPTRWSSSFLMMERLLEVKIPLKTVLDQHGWDNLALSEWITLETMCKLLKPFAQYTALVSADEYTTISSVIPIVMELNLHLEDMKKIPELSGISTLLQTDLKRRFRKFTNPGDDSHEPLFVASTLLDPRYKPLINPSQAKSAKTELLRLLKDSNGGISSSSSSSVHSIPSSVHQEESADPPPKKRPRFSHLTKVLEEKLKEGLEKAAKHPLGELELDKYMEAVHSVPDEDDPLNFWVEHQDAYPLLSSVALDILSIPGSSAPVERVFSTAGEATSAKRNRLADKNLEREILIRKNREYLYV